VAVREIDPRVARRRAAALAGHGGDEVEARRYLADPDGGVRAAALGALARLGAVTPGDVAVAAGDADAVVRRRAAEVIATTADLRDAATTVLRSLLDDRDASVVEVTAWACGELEPADAGLVAPLAVLAGEHDDPLVREAAVAALGAIGDAAGLPAILAATEDKPAVRRRAVLALAPFDGAEVDAALERATSDRDPQVRQAAEDLLRAE
jgi:HEAT repeat protein